MTTREVKDLLDQASTTQYGVTKLATHGGTTAATVVQADDARLAAAADLAAHLLADPSHAAETISVTALGVIGATNVQDALQELADGGALAAEVHAATGKTTPVDADELPLADSAAAFALKKLTWANVKATIKAYADTFYATLIHASRHKSGGADPIRLDELAVPTADVSLNSHKITNLATPSASGDAATKGYADGLLASATVGAIKDPVRAATTGNGTLATAYENGDTLDGVTLATGDRILLKDQTTGSENGIYTVNASGAPTRATDFDTSGEVEAGALVVVEEGTANADRVFVLTTDAPITLGTTALAFSPLGSLIGALLAANNLSEIVSPSAARANLGLAIGTDVEAHNANLTTIAGLTATTNNFLVAVASAWASRTPAQVKTTLALVKGDVGLGNVDNTSDATKDAAATTLTNKTLTTPTIGDFSSAQHTHQNSAGGATLDAAAIASGVLAIGRLATGTPTGAKFVRDDGTLAVPAGTGISDPTSAEGDLLYRHSSAVAALAIPATGPNGQRLAVVGGLPAWTDEIATAMRLWDDFNAGTLTSGQLGQLGWTFNGGGPTAVTLVAEAGHPGILRRGTAASTGNNAALSLNPSSSVVGNVLPADNFDISFIIRLGSNDANTTIQYGLSDTPTAATPANGIYVEKVDADTSWFGVCRSGSSQTRTAALATCDTTTWHRFRMRRKDASTIGFSIDGGAEIDVTGTIPTAALCPVVVIKTSANAAKTYDLDAFAMVITGLAR